LTVRLHLVRHAESTWNAEGRIQGRADPALSEQGLWQARRLADRFRQQRFDALYSSPQQRARQTAERIAEVTGLPVQLDNRLMEHDTGVFTGLVWEQVVDRFPDFAKIFIEQSPDMPDGEKRADLRARTSSVMQEIVAAHPGGSVVIVTHGGLMGAYLVDLLGLDPQRRHPFEFENGSISVVDVGGAVPKLRRLNDVCHLSLPVSSSVSLGVGSSSDDSGDGPVG
jgi:probable phosphoglycerate mutase